MSRHRIPTQDAKPTEFSRFSFELWEGLNGKYSFYVERWKRTLEFLRDQHWQSLKEYSRDALPDWRRFPLQNFTLAFYNDYLTDYLKSEVRFSAIPASADPEDLDAAEIGEDTLKYLWERLNFDRVRIDLGAWIMACGTGVLRVFWDTNTGDQVPLAIPTPDGQIMPIDPQTLQPFVGDPIMVDAGEIGVEVVSPQFVRWAENPSHGVMIGLLLTYEQVVAYYGEDMADQLTYSDSHEGISSDLNEIQQPGTSSSPVSERALVIEHYLPRSAQHPEGLWWTSAGGGKVLVHEPWPLPGGKIPVVSFRWIPIPGEPNLGVSPLYGLTFENKIYEEITARILEWYAKAKPKRLLKAGGGLTYGDITDEPYQELIVNQGGEPEDLPVADAPAGLFRILGQIQNDFSITSGRAFEEGGEMPEGLATMRLRTPSEYKQSKAITTAFMNAKAAWKQIGELLLLYAATFYDESRVVAVQGPDKAFMWRQFAGEKLVKNGGLAARVIVDDIPLFPQNRQNLRDTVIALLQSQAGQILFASPDGQLDMDRVNAAMKATGLDADLDVIDPDVLEARNEQVIFKNLPEGEAPPEPQSWQNAVTHYNEHTRVLKSVRFKAWPQHAQQAFLDHVSATEQILNEQAQQEAQAMVEQERELRRVRAQEELRADVQEKWATQIIELVAKSAGLEIEDLMGLLDKQRVPKSTPEGESNE